MMTSMHAGRGRTWRPVLAVVVGAHAFACATDHGQSSTAPQGSDGGIGVDTADTSLLPGEDTSPVLHDVQDLPDVGHRDLLDGSLDDMDVLPGEPDEMEPDSSDGSDNTDQEDVLEPVDVDVQPPDVASPCLGGDDCSDGDDCTVDSCVAGACQHAPVQCPPGAGGCPRVCMPPYGCDTDDNYVVGVPCGPLNQCSLEAYCEPTYCAGVSPWRFCDDGNPCTIDPPCDPNLGCVYPPEPDGSPCEDDNPCTATSCHSGQCAVDANSCPCDPQADDCDLVHGDGNACNGVLTCEPGPEGAFCTLLPSSVIVCEALANEDCAAASCDPGTGACSITYSVAGSSCSDGSPCTKDDVCDGVGACAGVPDDCDDGDPCTEDRCESKGCVHDWMDCNDGNPWTVDSCVPGGCHHEPAPGNPYLCTTDADCAQSPCCTSVCDSVFGVCMPGGTPAQCSCSESATCADKDPCTLDIYTNGVSNKLPQTCCGACLHVPVEGCCSTSASCDDADPCTNDLCVDGKCKHEPVASCLGAECLSIAGAYEDLVSAGAECAKHEDCVHTVPQTVLCGCTAIVGSVAASAALESKAAEFIAAGCSDKVSCEPCADAVVPMAAVCLEGKCTSPKDIPCSVFSPIMAEIWAGVWATAKSLPCDVDQDCRKCLVWNNTEWDRPTWTHKDVSLTYANLLDDWAAKVCCCADGDMVFQDAPKCIANVCKPGEAFPPTDEGSQHFVDVWEATCPTVYSGENPEPWPAAP